MWFISRYQRAILAAKRSSTQKVAKEIDRAINFLRHLKFECKQNETKFKASQSSLSVSEINESFNMQEIETF